LGLIRDLSEDEYKKWKKQARELKRYRKNYEKIMDNIALNKDESETL
jgi:hypothetical protein